MKRQWIFLSLLTILNFCTSLHGQIAPDTYWVSFTDKNNSPYSLNNPEKFLSEGSIARRHKQNIAIVENDIPVNKIYLDSLSSLGIKIHNISKWFNGAAIISNDYALLDTLHFLSFIKEPVTSSQILTTKSSFSNSSKYGFLSESSASSDSQLEMLNLHLLHQSDYKGNGILIGILDAGFERSTTIESLQHTWENNKIIGIKDFVKDSDNILENHSHGTLVFSIIAAHWTDNLYGSAPEASFILIRTENGNSEYILEEYNWISGAEYADSLGVDIINSSLGYSTFDNPSQDHNYDDLDGKTTPISIAAKIAAQKGILVVTSAGNSGDDAWHYITAPGDTDSIITVGAVDADEILADFSSRGPSADGRIKPDVCAMGKGTAGQVYNGSIYSCNGTSCSAPVVSGLAASLWQKFPTATAQQIREAIIYSSHLVNNPDNNYGFGLPDALIAQSLLEANLDSSINLTSIKLYPNPTSGAVYLKLYFPWVEDTKEGTILLQNLNGQVLSSKNELFKSGLNIISISETTSLDAGYYIVQIILFGKVYSFPLLKLD